MASEPSEADSQEVDKLRQHLAVQFNVWDSHPRKRSESRIYPYQPQTIDDNPIFDDLDGPDLPSQGDANRPQTPNITEADCNVTRPERRILSMPSTWPSDDNSYCAVELELRIHHAARSLETLRDLIADKSFQYSHVIRVAPRKGVRTRARSTIAKLNHRISYHCRVYGMSRTAMVNLKADAATLKKYRTLEPEDIRSSTALLNPNEPGSSKLKLSWIWQTGSTGDQGSSEVLLECKCLN